MVSKKVKPTRRKMLTYEKLKKKPGRFLALTSVTVEEFDKLLPTFKRSWEADVEKRAYAKPRKRKVGGGRKPSLKSLEDMLLFILLYFKIYPLQEGQGALFGMSQGQAKQVLVIIWDRASWHKSKTLKQWIHQHNQQVRQHGGVRLLTFLLPSKSPRLNPMEPIWLHTKRKVAEPEAQLSVKMLKERLSALFDTTLVSSSLKPSD